MVEDESAAEEERVAVVVEACEGSKRDLIVSHVGSVEDEGVAEVSVVRPASGIGPDNVSAIVFVLHCVRERRVLEVLAFQIVQDVLQTHCGKNKEQNL